MSQFFWSLLAIPRAPNPPGPMRRDWLIVAAFIPVVIGEVIFRDDLAWRAFALVFGILPLFALPWRRVHPLAVVAVGFVMHIAGDIALLFGSEESAALVSSAWVLLLPYALVRWGSGRDAMLGIAIVIATHAHAFDGLVNALIGVAIMLLPAELGYAVRHQTESRERRMDDVKAREREQIARELHDTVAHHVSAIAIQAQAGRAVRESDPGAALDALAAIEEAASRTLSEMRSMVGALRNGDDADLAPQRGIADLERLSETAGSSPIVDVNLVGDLGDLRPAVDAALYRIAQESITNALRHAHDPSHINVSVQGDSDSVRLTVADDGGYTPLSTNIAAGVDKGYGLEGMSERATLLGGSLVAGPNGNQGWTVTAVLPKRASVG